MPCSLSAQLPQPLAFPPSAYGLEPVESDASLEGGLVAYLKGHRLVSCLAGEHVYPYFVPRHVEQGDYPCIVYQISEQPVPGITAQTGVAVASIDLECWHTTLDTAARLANAVRAAVQGFRGTWGLVGIVGAWYQGFDDDAEKPADDSGAYWFVRTLTFDVSYVVPIHTF